MGNFSRNIISMFAPQYTKIGGVRFTDGSSIDIPIVDGSSFAVDVDFINDAEAVSYTSIMYINSSSYTGAQMSNTTTHFCYIQGTWYQNNATIGSEYLYGIKQDGFYINNALVNSVNRSQFGTTLSLIGSTKGKSVTYKFVKIYNNSSVVASLIPMKDADGNVFLYDEFNKTKYGEGILIEA